MKTIYASNTFQIPNMIAYFCFQRILPSQLLHKIQAIHIIWVRYDASISEVLLHGTGPSHISYWNEAWRQISEMRGLMCVRVDFAVPFSTYYYDSEERLLFSPIAAAYREGLKEIYVFVDSRTDKYRTTWPGHTEPLRNEWPFHIIRGISNLGYLPPYDFSWVYQLSDNNMPDRLR